MAAQQTLFDLLSPSPLVAGLVVLGMVGVGVVAASRSVLKGRYPVFGAADGSKDGGNQKNELVITDSTASLL